MERRAGEHDGVTSSQQLNYYNYFTETEEEFVRRRGKSLLVSPLDWSLIESWKNAGIPLHVVIRAINKTFDAWDARPGRHRRINSMFYCQQEVEAGFAEYRLSQVGAAEGESSAGSSQTELPGERKSRSRATVPFPREAVLEFLSRSQKELADAVAHAAASGYNDVRTAISRAANRLQQITVDLESAERPDAEGLERDLDAIDTTLLEAIREDLGRDGIERLRSEAETQLKPFKKKMDKSIYLRTLDNYVSRRLREAARLPRLSLFYM